MLEEKQSRTCLGCNQLERSWWGGTSKYVCSIGMQKARTDVYEMPRCKKYSDGESMTRDQSEQIEELLLTWYRWQIRQSHAETLSHFYRPEDRTCRGYVTPSSADEDDEVAYQWADDRQSEQVQLCVDMLRPEQRAAISTSMRNKESGRTVWSSARAGDQHATYQAAKERLLPMLLSRHLIKIVELGRENTSDV
ncbi:hypothetical protein PPMP20_04380 [Paraburkholderia phymatum]|uniref:hypothetical protein n=1 Tax=Paraburkholderia phymatum TaxID=148447 RepID=UPI0012FE626C|nr:hypothetical protein [Paraburkholderia phymatum]